MNKLRIWNNPEFNIKYYVEIDLDTGKSIYETNDTNLPARKYRCFFLLNHSARKRAAEKLAIISGWQGYYGIEKGIILDGYRWKITIERDEKQVFSGENNKPLEFDHLIQSLELIIRQSLGSVSYRDEKENDQTT